MEDKKKKKEKKKRKKFIFDKVRLHMVQFVVLLNGLLLTAAAFFVLQIFIDKMMEKKLENLLTDNRQEIIDSIHSYEDTFESIAALFNRADTLSDKELLKMFRFAGEVQAKRFDQLYWVRLVDGKMRAYPLLKKGGAVKKGYSFSFSMPDRDFIDELISKTGEEKEVTFVSGVSGTEYALVENQPRTMVAPFALVYPVFKREEDGGFFIGLVSINREPNIKKLSDKETIVRLSISDDNSNARIYHMDWFKDDAVHFMDNPSLKTFNFALANTELSVRLDFRKSEEEEFVELVPWIFLAFGLILTFTGWLYVRNNQNQSFRLRSMNRTLAEKNMELNRQVSERERLNKIIAKAENENKEILDSVKDVIFDVNEEGEILFLNESWRRVTGLDTQYSIGQNIFDMLHPHDQEEQRKNFRLFSQGRKEPYRNQTRLRTHGGGFRSVELAVSMIRRDEDKNIRIAGTFTDEEARTRAERALNEAERKYRTIWENAAGGIFQLTEEGQYLSVNPAMARILGYDSPDTMLKNIRNAHKEVYVDQNDHRRFLREVERATKARATEAEVRKRDGSHIWVYENVRAVRDEEGGILYLEGSMEDITERKNSDIHLRQAKMESDLANRAKSEFLANMSHELRTPLNAIIGFAEIIKNEVFGPIEKKAYWEYACDIYESGRHLLHVINEILDVSRIEAGERQLSEAVVDLKKLVKSATGLMNSKAESSELTITDMLPEDLPSIVAEELAIKQVIINILSNAIKFTQSGGRITINGAYHESSGELHLSVTDTGVGLDDFEITKALSPFGQVNSSLSRSESGTGLGLTLVDSLMKLHNGRVDLVSQKGVGTTVTLIFPEGRVAVSKIEKKETLELPMEAELPEEIEEIEPEIEIMPLELPKTTDLLLEEEKEAVQEDGLQDVSVQAPATPETKTVRSEED